MGCYRIIGIWRSKIRQERISVCFADSIIFEEIYVYFVVQFNAISCVYIEYFLIDYLYYFTARKL